MTIEDAPHFHKGKLPARPYSSDHTPIKELLKAVPTGTIPPTPKQFGHGYDFGATGWLMLGNGPCDDNSINEQYYAYKGGGNCVWAEFGHGFMESAKDAGRPIPTFTCASALNNYCAYLGIGNYQHLNAQNDTGTDMQAALKRVQTVGYTDANGNVYKIGKTVTAEPGNLKEMWSIAYLFELADIGVNLQQAQEDAFPGTWDYDPNSETIGGHCVPVMGKTGLISWKTRVQFTKEFYEQLNDECYGYIDPLRYSLVTGETLEDYTDADLEKYIAMYPAYKQAQADAS